MKHGKMPGAMLQSFDTTNSSFLASMHVPKYFQAVDLFISANNLRGISKKNFDISSKYNMKLFLIESRV